MERRTATVLAALAAAAFVVAALVLVPFGASWAEAATVVVAVGATAGMGVRIDRALPGHGVALRLALTGLAVAVPGFFDALRAVGSADRLWARWAAITADLGLMPVLFALAGVVLAFPSGAPPPGRWARAERLVGLSVLLGIVCGIFDAEDVKLHGTTIVSPLPVVRTLGVLALATVPVLLAWLVAVSVNAVRRYRRGTGVERLQLRCLAYASTLVVAALLGCGVEALVGGGVGAAVTTVVLVGALLALPAAITVAILRHRLYEIDRLINRTLVYLSLTVVLALAYAAVVLAMGIVLGGGTTWPTAAATLVVATAFRPARATAQRAVDRRFAQRRYQGLRRIEAFLAEVRAGREQPERIGAVLSEALDDRGLEVFFRLPASDGYADANGRVLPLPADSVRARTPVRRGDLELAVVLHDPALAATPDTLDGILRATGLALEIARLRVEVRVQLAEVEASRNRLAAAAQAEREKLQRDLHDGSQQRLVALGLALRHAQHQLGAGDPAASATLDAAVGEVAASISELRELARGLGPRLLDRGLAVALADVASRAPVPVTVEVAPGKLPDELERTAFFVASEAITNAVKHAQARHVRVRVSQTPAVLRLDVADDGVGGAAPLPGGGLVGLAERVGTCGGTFDVVSRAGAGTSVVAEFPLGA